MKTKMKTYKVRFIFFKLYKSIELSAKNLTDAENEICEKYLIPKRLKREYKFHTTLVK
jgi:hypothetical protein